MVSTRKSPSVYAKFMYLAQVVRSLDLFPSLDPLEERLLNQLVAFWAIDKEVTVLEALALAPDVPAGTWYRCLNSLRQKGMLQLAGEETDQPTRHLVATPLAEKYFARLEQCMATAIKC